MIELRNLTVGYNKKVVISGINLSFQQGEFICLLGPNGAGKTTFLRTISRHIPPVAGQITLKQRPLDKYQQWELARIMAVVLTEKVSPPLFTVRQFVSLGRYPYTDFLGRLQDTDIAAVDSALAAVGGLDLSNRDFASLSDGERQKVLLARALCQDPEILLLDEPTAHLDLKHRVEVMSILRRLCTEKGLLILCSIHDLDLASKVADKVTLIKDGKIEGWGPPEEILSPSAVSRLFDFKGASFSLELGGIELKCAGRGPRVFVIGGAGRGAPIMRALSKAGYSITTGVLFENDVDFFVAAAVDARLISQRVNGGLNPDLLKVATEELSACSVVVDVRPTHIPAYEANGVIIERAAQKGIPVICPSSKDGHGCNLVLEQVKAHLKKGLNT